MSEKNPVDAIGVISLNCGSSGKSEDLEAVEAHGSMKLTAKKKEEFSGQNTFNFNVFVMIKRFIRGKFEALKRRVTGYGALKFQVEVAVMDKATGKVSKIPRKWWQIWKPKLVDNIWRKKGDVGDVQFVQLIAAWLGSAQSSCVKNTSGTAESISAGATPTAVNVVAGTGGTTAAVTDYTLGAQVSGGPGSQTATIGAVNTTTGVLQITANMQGPASATTYKEIGIYLTISSYTIQICRDYNSSGWSVSTTQYLSVTYTLTPS